MRPCSLSLFLLFIATAAFSQDRKKVINESGDRLHKIREAYFVLKSDNSIKDGSYQRWQNDKLAVSGYYKNGQMDSIWEIYARQVLVSRRWYDDGRPVGKWELFNLQGALSYTYDFTTSKVTYPSPPATPDTTTRFYLNDAGQWSRGRLDQDVLPLFSPGEWLNFLLITLLYPTDALEKNEQGKVIISIVVDENGHASDYAVFTSVSPSLDKEALRVVSANDNLFAPGQKDGKKVRSVYLQPIEFRLKYKG